MKRILVTALLAVFATAAFAHEGHDHIKNGKPVTLTGEVVDFTCYMQHPANAVGPEHAKCARSCIAKGLPIGFLATNGALYTIIGPEHEPVSTQVADYLGKTSTIKGTLVEQHGVKAIALTSIGAANAAAKTSAKAAEPKSKADAMTYTCEMHPEIHASAPGTCPKCGMTLVPEKKK